MTLTLTHDEAVYMAAVMNLLSGKEKVEFLMGDYSKLGNLCPKKKEEAIKDVLLDIEEAEDEEFRRNEAFNNGWAFITC